jgi:hypothetical protein
MNSNNEALFNNSLLEDKFTPTTFGVNLLAPYLSKTRPRQVSNPRLVTT